MSVMADWKAVSTRVGAYTAKVLGKKAPAVDVEDISSEAVARAFEAVGDIGTQEVVKEALRCVRNLASSRRRRRRKGRLVLVPRTPSSFGEPPPDMPKQLDQAAMIETLKRELVDDPEARAVIDAVLAGAATREQIAAALGTSRAVVHNAQRRLYRRARQLFGDAWSLP